MPKDGAATIDSAQLVATLFALIPVPIAVADGHGNVVLANSSFHDVFPGIARVVDLPRNQAEVPGIRTFGIQTLPLNDCGFKMIYGADLSNEAHLRRQVNHLEKMAAIGRAAAELVQEISDQARPVSVSRAGLLDSLLVLAGARAPRLTKVNLNAVVRNAIALQGQPGKAPQADFNLDLAENLPVLDGDSMQLEQVVLALVVRGESPNRGERRKQTVHIQTTVDARKIQLNVSHQSGPNGTETSVTTDGTSMDLSLCAQIVREHGGELYAWSPYRGGLTLTVELPIRLRS